GQTDSSFWNNRSRRGAARDMKVCCAAGQIGKARRKPGECDRENRFRVAADDFIDIAAEDLGYVGEIFSVVDYRDLDDFACLTEICVSAARQNLLNNRVAIRNVRVMANEQGASAGHEFFDTGYWISRQSGTCRHHLGERVKLDEERARPHGQNSRSGK